MTWIFLFSACTISLLIILVIGFRPERYRILLRAICTIILVLTLFFGLKPKGYRFMNQAEWLPGSNGIVFKGISMIHSEGSLGAIGITDSITLTMTLKPYLSRGVSRIFSIVDFNGDELLTIDQLSTSILASLRTKDKNKPAKAYLSKALSTDSSRSVAIGICRGSLWLESENKKKGVSKLLPQLESDFLENSSLFIGYGPSGSNPWNGELYRLTISTGCLRHNSDTDDSHSMTHSDFFHYSYGKPIADYSFERKFDRRIVNRFSEKWDLLIPVYPKMYKYGWFQPLTTIIPLLKKANRSIIKDIIVNLVGFIPLGAVFMLLFVNTRKTYSITFLFTLLIALLVSTIIEFMQILIPTRSSQTIDIVFNTIGACIGAFLIRLIRTRR